jgi:enolase-phosphatase E1
VITTSGSSVVAVLLDVEGTTTPLAFVHDTLSAYARAHLHSYLKRLPLGELDSVARAFEEEYNRDVAAERTPSVWVEAGRESRTRCVDAYARWLMLIDRKSPILKELQGRIWQAGYRSGALVAEVFTDVPRALERWRNCGIGVGIFSSGSALAQTLLLQYSTSGDLRSLVRWHFDTTTGAKTDPESYRRISVTIGTAPETVLFVSDSVRELDAARDIGMQTARAARPGNYASSEHADHLTIHDFDALL